METQRKRSAGWILRSFCMFLLQENRFACSHRHERQIKSQVHTRLIIPSPYSAPQEPKLSLVSLDTLNPCEKADSELLPEDWGRSDKWDTSQCCYQ